MSEIPPELRARLVHDVGKHVARTARNVRGSHVPAPLVPLLLKDLYRLDGTRRASLVFAELCASFDVQGDPRLSLAATLLGEIDALEAEVARSDDAALLRVVTLALEVESELRTLLSPTERA